MPLCYVHRRYVYTYFAKYSSDIHNKRLMYILIVIAFRGDIRELIFSPKGGTKVRVK